ncbi:FecR domain-containing protein [Pseudomonas sp. NBRC 111143]|uniref:FecR family protein n=3 Tax=unclassified Pseudomonas TaxID=196821 RepID=UPI0006D454EE|nr:FecR domain-containing protein [Pseudomonas sp. NBRC 111143]
MTEHSAKATPDAAAREQASAWFTQRQAFAQNPALRQRFEQWRDADPQHAAAYDALQALWDADAFKHALQHLEADLHLPAMPANRPKRPDRTPLYASAAALLLMLVAGWRADLPLRLQADYLTSTAQTEQVELPDGSHLMLGSHSAISTEFAADHRRIRLLRGEIYVEAFHDTTRPLTIQAGEAEVTVVGTKFSVSKGDDSVTVAVREGRVRFADAAGETSLLQAGHWQQLRSLRLQPMNLDGGERQMAWVNGRLSFQDAPLAEVIDTLRRYYPAPILLLNKSAAHQRVSGNYQVDDPVAIAQALSTVTSAQLTRLPGGILIIR